MAKIVYQDGDYTKVARGKYTEDDVFIIVEELGHKIRINKRFIISVKEEGDNNDHWRR